MDHPECTEEYDGTNPCHLTPRSSTYPDRPHEGEEFGYVLQGVIHIHLGQRVYTAKKGETFYFAPNCEHSISAGKKDWCKIYLGKHTTQFLIILIVFMYKTSI